jgi:DNA-binding IclR family transcriptional regulator
MIQSVVRALRILETIHEKENGAGLVETARALGLEKSTVYNLMKTLLAEGYVKQDGSGGKYRLGEKLRVLASGGLDDSYLAEKTKPACVELQKITGENISLTACRKGSVKIICRVLCDNEVVAKPNNFKPLYSTFTGRCLLAQLNDQQISCVTERLGFPNELWDGIKEQGKMKKALRRIKKDGGLIFESETRHLGGIAKIIEAPPRIAPLAIGTALPLFRFREKKNTLIKSLVASQIGDLSRK